MSENGIFFKEGQHLSHRMHGNAAQAPIDFSRCDVSHVDRLQSKVWAVESVYDQLERVLELTPDMSYARALMEGPLSFWQQHRPIREGILLLAHWSTDQQARGRRVDHLWCADHVLTRCAPSGDVKVP